MSLISTIYSSTDPGAPQLSGTPGSLISVLRAVLVNGYGTAPNDKPGLGWTEEFTDTNKVVFQNSQDAGSGYRLRVLDDGSASAGGSARSASVRAFSTMTDIDNGSDPTPTTADMPNGVIWPKSTVLSSATRPWWAIGNERCIYLFVDVQGVGGADVPLFAGDLLSIKPGDQHAFALNSGDTAVYTGSLAFTHSRLFHTLTAMSSQPNSGSALIIARSHSGAPGAVRGNNVNTLANFSGAYGGPSGLPYPVPASGGLIVDRPWVNDGANSPRGFYPGLYVPQHEQPLADLAAIEDPEGFPSGTVLVAKNFRALSQGSVGGRGQVFFDATAEWI